MSERSFSPICQLEEVDSFHDLYITEDRSPDPSESDDISEEQLNKWIHQGKQLGLTGDSLVQYTKSCEDRYITRKQTKLETESRWLIERFRIESDKANERLRIENEQLRIE